jgi:hypothetical protein
MLESLGNNLGRGVDDVDDDVPGLSLQEIIPIKKNNPIKCFMPKKYGFSCRQPKQLPVWMLINVKG